MLNSETWTNKKKEVVEDHDHPRPEGTRNMKKRSLSHLSAMVYYMVSLFLHRRFWLYFPFIFIAMLIYYPHWNSYWFRCRFIIIALFQYHSHCHRFCYYDIFHLSYFRVFFFIWMLQTPVAHNLRLPHANVLHQHHPKSLRTTTKNKIIAKKRLTTRQWALITRNSAFGDTLCQVIAHNHHFLKFEIFCLQLNVLWPFYDMNIKKDPTLKWFGNKLIP